MKRKAEAGEMDQSINQYHAKELWKKNANNVV